MQTNMFYSGRGKVLGVSYTIFWKSFIPLRGRFQSSTGFFIHDMKEFGNSFFSKLFRSLKYWLVVDLALDSLWASLLSHEDSLGWRRMWTFIGSIAETRVKHLTKIDAVWSNNRSPRRNDTQCCLPGWPRFWFAWTSGWVKNGQRIPANSRVIVLQPRSFFFESWKFLDSSSLQNHWVAMNITPSSSRPTQRMPIWPSLEDRFQPAASVVIVLYWRGGEQSSSAIG